MSTCRTVVVCLAFGLALSGAAQARLPLNHTKLIVTGKSIAGLEMGMRYPDAATLWGSSGSCHFKNGIGSCRYDDDLQSSTGVASFTAANSRIDSVLLTSPYDLKQGRYVPVGPLTAFHTARGIHIGSSLKSVRHAYPKGKVAPTHAAVTLKSGLYTTTFYILKAKVYAIGIAKPPHKA